MDKVKSLAYVYYKPGDVRLEEKEISCGPTDLLVRVFASARCGTDKTIFHKGHYKVDSNAPIILGHELTGKIVHVGKQVQTLTEGIGYKEGQKLSKEYLSFEIGERVTFQSRIARYQNGLLMLDDPITILSFYIDGGYSQYMKITKELIQSGSVLRLPDSVSDEEGALIEPAACALESIFSTPHSRRRGQRRILCLQERHQAGRERLHHRFGERQHDIRPAMQARGQREDLYDRAVREEERRSASRIGKRYPGNHPAKL